MADEMPRRRSCDMWDWPLQSNDGMVNVKNDRDRFEADLELPFFRPNEIDIRVLDDQLVLHCAQERGNGMIGRTPREVHRTYVLPPDVDLNSLKSIVKRDGILQIVASKKDRFVTP